MNPNPTRPLNIFLGCPGDMAPERVELLKLESRFADIRRPVKFLHWGIVTGGGGRPQDVIFKNFPVETWDIFVGLLWKHFGQSSGEFDKITGHQLTGTEEGFVRAYDQWKASGEVRPHLLLYRCERNFPHNVDGTQVVAVREFFRKMEADGARPAHHPIAKLENDSPA